MTIIEGTRRQTPPLERYGEKGENSKSLPLNSVKLARRLAGLKQSNSKRGPRCIMPITRRLDATDFLISRVMGQLSMFILSLKTSTFRR